MSNINASNIKNNFSLDQMFQDYLQKVGLDPKKISKVQLSETKRAFYAACSRMLLTFINELSLLPEEDGVREMSSMLSQAQDYWLTESNQMN